MQQTTQCTHQQLTGSQTKLCQALVKLLLQRVFTDDLIITLIAQQVDGAVQAVSHKGTEFFLIQKIRIENHFCWRELRQLIFQLSVTVFFQFGTVDLTGGYIAKSDTVGPFFHENGTDVVIGALVQHIGFQHGARCDHTSHFPLHNAVCCGRVFHLVTDCHLIAFFDQASHVVFVAVIRNAAHRRALLLTASSAGQGQLKLLGYENRIIKKHLIKVSQSEEQNMVFMLLFDIHILLHHWR